MNVDITKEFAIYKEIKQEISSFDKISYKGEDYIRIHFWNDYKQFERQYKLNTILNET